jgi:hypothetical protein
MKSANKGSRNSRRGVRKTNGKHICSRNVSTGHRCNSCKKKKNIGNSVITSCFTWCRAPTNNIISKKISTIDDFKEQIAGI